MEVVGDFEEVVLRVVLRANTQLKCIKERICEKESGLERSNIFFKEF